MAPSGKTNVRARRWSAGYGVIHELRGRVAIDARCPRSVHGPGAAGGSAGVEAGAWAGWLREPALGHPDTTPACSQLVGHDRGRARMRRAIGRSDDRERRLEGHRAGKRRSCRRRAAATASDWRRTRKCPEEPSILGRVPQSKLQRSQGFGPSAPSGKNHYDRRTAAAGYRLIHDLRGSAGPESGRFSTARPPTALEVVGHVAARPAGPTRTGLDPRRRRAGRGAPSAPGRTRHTAPAATSAGTTKRPKEPIDPSARFRRCKHLRLGSVEPRSVAHRR